ncbi:hypothetical protein DSECCO2_581860 [anaerobic digester metagenome]
MEPFVAPGAEIRGGVAAARRGDDVAVVLRLAVDGHAGGEDGAVFGHTHFCRVARKDVEVAPADDFRRGQAQRIGKGLVHGKVAQVFVQQGQPVGGHFQDGAHDALLARQVALGLAQFGDVGAQGMSHDVEGVGQFLYLVTGKGFVHLALAALGEFGGVGPAVAARAGGALDVPAAALGVAVGGAVGTAAQPLFPAVASGGGGGGQVQVAAHDFLCVLLQRADAGGDALGEMGADDHGHQQRHDGKPADGEDHAVDHVQHLGARKADADGAELAPAHHYRRGKVVDAFAPGIQQAHGKVAVLGLVGFQQVQRKGAAKGVGQHLAPVVHDEGVDDVAVHVQQFVHQVAQAQEVCGQHGVCRAQGQVGGQHRAAPLAFLYQRVGGNARDEHRQQRGHEQHDERDAEVELAAKVQTAQQVHSSPTLEGSSRSLENSSRQGA